MKVHIQGMGLIGSMLAWTLYRSDVQFTWNDTHQKVKAWKASTGCVYPCGDPTEMEAYHQWRRWHEKGAPWEKKLDNITEEAAYWFITRKPPHDGDYKIIQDISPMRMGEFPTVQVNVQQLVKGTREFFAKQETEPGGWDPRSTQLVKAHGFTEERLTHYKWGWSAKAEVHFSRKLIHASNGWRICADLKRGMVSPLIYAYPMPGTNLHYIGSSIIRQTTPKKLHIPSKIDFWTTEVEELTEGLVSLVDVKEYREGWRPCGEPEDKKLVRRIGDALVVRPMQHSGVRLSPLVMSKIMRKLEVK